MRSKAGTLQQTLTMESDLQSTQHIDDVDKQYKARENIEDVDKRHKNSILLEEYSKRKKMEKRRDQALDGSNDKVKKLNLTTLDHQEIDENEQHILMDQLLDYCYAEDCH